MGFGIDCFKTPITQNPDNPYPTRTLTADKEEEPLTMYNSESAICIITVYI